MRRVNESGARVTPDQRREPRTPVFSRSSRGTASDVAGRPVPSGETAVRARSSSQELPERPQTPQKTAADPQKSLLRSLFGATASARGPDGGTVGKWDATRMKNESKSSDKAQRVLRTLMGFATIDAPRRLPVTAFSDQGHRRGMDASEGARSRGEWVALPSAQQPRDIDQL